jgi:outer membrane protein assembly factor BamB
MTSKFRTSAQIALTLAGLGALTVNAMGADKVPATAKLLTKAEIMAAYSGATLKWTHPYTDKGTGTAAFNTDLTSGKGTFVFGKDKGEFESKITFKGDQYCWAAKGKGEKKFGKRVCNLVYLDGKIAYEVDPKSKQILSVNTLQ